MRMCLARERENNSKARHVNQVPHHSSTTPVVCPKELAWLFKPEQRNR
jgi:hypothetical protein